MKLVDLFETLYFTPPGGPPIYRNSSKIEFWSVLNRSKGKELRGLGNEETGEILIWDAYMVTHAYVKSLLGIIGVHLEFNEERAIDAKGWTDDVYEAFPIISRWYGKTLYEDIEEPQDWREALEDADTPEDVARILQAADARQITLRGSIAEPTYVIDDQVIEWDGKSSYTNVEDVNEWLSTVDVDKWFPNYEDEWNARFWKRPYLLYHATTKDHLDDIMQHGLQPMDKTRGLSNRGVGHAVFTTSNFEETVEGSYGDVVFEIDVDGLQKSPNRPYVSREPHIVEYELRMSLAHLLQAHDFYMDEESGMSPDTVIVHGDIPVQYLTRMK